RDGVGRDAYWRQRTWKRLAVIAAGPGTNLVFAIILLAIVYMIGVPSAASRRVDAIEKGTPAAQAGLKSGDTIIGVNRAPTRTFDQVRHAIQTSHGHPLALYVIHKNGLVDYERVSMIGIALILFIYVLGISNDIGNLHGG